MTDKEKAKYLMKKIELINDNHTKREFTRIMMDNEVIDDYNLLVKALEKIAWPYLTPVERELL